MGLLSQLSGLSVTLTGVLLISVTAAFSNNTCYFPDGSVAVYDEMNFVQCKETSHDGVTHCCHPQDICTVAGYCVGGAGVYYRGGCTDKTWTSTLCPPLCATYRTNSFANFYPCIPGKFSHDNWTCEGCDSSTFHFDPGSLFVPQIEAAKATSTVVITRSATGIVATTCTANEIVVTTTIATGSLSTQSNMNSCPTHHGTLVGLSVGLSSALALSAIASFVGLFIERKKRRAAEKIAEQRQTMSCDQMDGKVYNREERTQSQQLHEVSNNEMVREAGSTSFYEIGH